MAKRGSLEGKIIAMGMQHMWVGVAQTFWSDLGIEGQACGGELTGSSSCISAYGHLEGFKLQCLKCFVLTCHSQSQYFNFFGNAC